MFSITEQFSAATKSQLEAQLNLLNSIASQAVASAEQVIALNISTAKASAEKTASTTRQLLDARDPREFFTVSTQAQSFDKVIDYSRQLFSIASSAQAELIKKAKAGLQDAAPARPAAAPLLAAPETKKAAEAKKPQPPVTVTETAPAVIVVATEPAPAPKAKAAAKAKPATATKPVVEAVAPLSEAPAAPAAKPAAVAFPTTKSVQLKAVAASGAASAKSGGGPAAKAQAAKQLDMLGGGKGKK